MNTNKENMILVASYTNKSFKIVDLYIGSTVTGTWSFQYIDKNGVIWNTGKAYKSKTEIMENAYQVLRNEWGFTRHEIKQEVIKSYALGLLGSDVTLNEIEAISKACMILGSEIKTDEAKNITATLGKLLGKLNNLIK